MNLQRIEQYIENKAIKVVMTDFDGTLVPISATPDSVYPAGKVKRLLSELSRKCLVAVISGRRLSDLRRLLPKLKMVLVGVHGAQIQWPDGSTMFAGGRETDCFIADLYSVLAKQCCRLPGIIIENKGCALALHYRLATETDTAYAMAMLRTLTEKYLDNGCLTWLEGKKVIELAPIISKSMQINHLSGRYLL